jgi:hypothetical protein
MKSYKISNLLGLKSFRTQIQEVSNPRALKAGASIISSIFLALGYYHHRAFYFSSLQYSTYFHNLTAKPILNINKLLELDNQQMYYSPLSQMEPTHFDQKIKMHTAKVTGTFDHAKEILVPSTKNGVRGYNVFAPFYYQNRSVVPDKLNERHTTYTPDYIASLPKNQNDRVAIGVLRGWYLF